MKKLMITACVVALAAMTQASVVNWSYSGYTFVGDTSSTRLGAGESVYLVNAATWTRAQLLTDFNTFGGTAVDFQASTAWKSAAQLSSGKTGANGKVDAVVGADGGAFNKEQGTAYYVIVKGDNLFVSTEKSSNWTELGDKYTFGFTSASNQTASRPAAALASGGLSTANGGAGWYYNDVPEPTSGLLLLLGVAGLALKRKRA